jgi:hypothetical protein
MQNSVNELLKVFCAFQESLKRIEINIPWKACEPMIRFHDSLGKSWALPLEPRRKISNLRALLCALFLNHPIQKRIETGQYLLRLHIKRAVRVTRGHKFSEYLQQDDEIALKILVSEATMRNCEEKCDLFSSPKCNVCKVLSSVLWATVDMEDNADNEDDGGDDEEIWDEESNTHA